MTQGDGMAEVTEADREKAMDIMGWAPLTYESFRVAADEGNPDDIDAIETVDAIARALAEEREKARVPFLALAEEWVRDESDGEPVDVLIRATFKACANDIRRAAEETE